MRRLVHRLAFALITIAIPAAAAAAPLTNADVVKLSKLGLGDEAVIAKIRQAEEVDFRIETDDLIALKEGGVSGKVIAAMIDRAAGIQPGISADGAQRAAAPPSPVKLVAGDQTIALSSLMGQGSSTFAYVTVLLWQNFPGLRASVRITESSPSFLIASDHDPRSRFFIVRLDVNDEDGDRSLKMGRSGAFSFRAGTNPDSDWTFPFDSTEEKKGLWRVTLRKPLKPGEYGVYVVQSQELYDFGVD
jgi:hypothetical protein